MASTALIIEDNPNHARVLQAYFEQVNFNIVLASSILEGESLARSLLDISQPSQSVVIIIDQELPLKGYSAVEGSTLALLLHEEIALGRLHPAHLVAVSAEMTPERRKLAHQAQCVHIWEKPVRFRDIEELYTSIKNPPSPRLADSTIHTLALNSLQLLRTVLSQPTLPAHEWTANDIYLILGFLADSLRIDQASKQYAEHLIHELGGVSQTLLRLRHTREELTAERQEILLRLLRQERKRDIQEDMFIGRTKLNNEIQTICEVIAHKWLEASL